MEKGKQARQACHDELVAEVIDRADWVLDQTFVDPHTGLSVHMPNVVIEMPCGRGFIDVALYRDYARRLYPGTTNPSVVSMREGVILEVKSSREKWCAGDVLRQLKTYRKHFLPIYSQPGKIVLALYSDRQLTPAEQLLLSRENVIVLLSKNASGSFGGK